MKRFLLLMVTLFGAMSFASAQHYVPQDVVDVIYTSDGIILQGTIVDQVPGVEYTIVTLKGKRFTIDALSVERITKERINGGIVTENYNYHYNPYIVHKLDEDGNPIFPLSPASAFTRSLFVPGLGQIYNGEELKGTLLLSGAIVGDLGVLVGTNVVSYAYEDLVGYSSAALFAGCYLYSLVEAPLFAARWNKKHGFKLNGRHPAYIECNPAMGIVGYGTDSSTAVGMNISLNF